LSEFGGIHMLYVGGSGESGNAADKREALASLGVDLVSFDTRPYLAMGPRPLRSLAHRINLGLPLRRLNRDLLAFVETLPALSHVWVDKGRWIRPETLTAIRDRFGASLVHYSNDSLFLANRSRHFRTSVRLYDFLFTTKDFELEHYRRAGARRVGHVFDGVSGERFFPRQPSGEQLDRYGADVTFIGRCEPHYAACLRAAAGSGADLRIWGPRWPRFARSHAWARPCVVGSGLWREDYPVALSVAKIGLGLLSKGFPETTTTRSFEIPACRTFMLAERTAEHLSLFEEGKEAEFFDSDDELVDKIRHYLAHPQERERIAAAGRERFLRSDYTRRARVRQMLKIVTGGEPAAEDPERRS
jgi:glycosyltransferase involved in cell wall biosynthesis